MIKPKSVLPAAAIRPIRRSGQGTTAMGRLAMLLVLAVTVLAAPARASQDSYDFSGIYDVYGHNPDDAGTYAGQANITWTGETYLVEWYILDQVFTGTGIGLGDVLAVGYDGGTAVYQLMEDRSLYGFWSPTGGTALGGEILTPILGK